VSRGQGGTHLNKTLFRRSEPQVDYSQKGIKGYKKQRIVGDDPQKGSRKETFFSISSSPTGDKGLEVRGGGFLLKSLRHQNLEDTKSLLP